ncbi:unnamed protein product [Vitrella brassicaformis CCMP3155]|uniref:Uncharacterized protein n=2 Tax=Vitrella brassicaformis TaxID=1169539 RepID=A0A0G4FLD2_VITBC|nr:unnamed protein product [Vitrella brassicaformis CCMP3155]|eukprot:CEM14194.1 unnamed protein product [Vitrella brassicaformis CCMP3155]
MAWTRESDAPSTSPHRPRSRDRRRLTTPLIAVCAFLPHALAFTPASLSTLHSSSSHRSPSPQTGLPPPSASPHLSADPDPLQQQRGSASRRPFFTCVGPSSAAVEESKSWGLQLAGALVALFALPLLASADYLIFDEGQLAAALQTFKTADSSESLQSSLKTLDELIPTADTLEGTPLKEEVVRSLLTKKREVLSSSKALWAGEVPFLYDDLKRKLDPLSSIALEPFLQVAPFIGVVEYLALLFVQRNFRKYFTAAYLGAAATIFAPIVYLLVTS